MNYISLFTGLGSDVLAFDELGWKPVAFSEIEPFQSMVLAKRSPGVPNLGDINKVDWSIYTDKVDLVIGGPPCPAFSTAGKRGSLSDPRGNLLLKYAEVLDVIRPAWSVFENVTGILDTRDNAFGQFLAKLVGADAPLQPSREQGRWPRAGMAAGPKRAACWRVLDAKYWGVPQQRQRVFLVAHSRDWTRAARVLIEPKGNEGNPEDRGEGGAEAAPRPEGGARRSPIRVYPDERLTDGYYAYDRLNNTVSRVVPAVSKSIGLTTGRGILLEVKGGKHHLRRLTPEEVEKLQGFPAGWTAIDWPRYKPASNKTRYEAIANAFPSFMIRWLGERITEAEQYGQRREKEKD